MLSFAPPAVPVDERQVDDLAAHVARGAVCLVTGAGVSTHSGIPDYRGPDGVRRVTPMQLGEFLKDPRGRRRYWARASVGWERFAAARPGRAHEQVAQLGTRGYVADLITQNVDGLHQRAGSEDVLELHGNLGRVVCLDCDTAFDRAVVQADIERDNPGHLATGARAALRPDGDVDLADSAVEAFRCPRCRQCGGDRLKPDVVFFGGSVPRDRVEQCSAAVASCQLLLVLGSSVSVMSSYRFVRQAVRSGTRVAVVTRGATRADADSVLKVDALVEDVLAGVLTRV